MADIGKETRYQRKQRLKNAGTWRAFQERREELVESGYTSKEADSIASKEFSDPDPLLNPSSEDVGGGLSKDEFETDNMDPQAIVQFVFNNVGLDDVKPSDAPCPGAFAYLMHVKKSPDLLEQFYSRVWTKLLSNVDTEEKKKFEDDGRKIINLAERLERESDQSSEEPEPSGDAVLSSGSEGPSGQSEVS